MISEPGIEAGDIRLEGVVLAYLRALDAGNIVEPKDLIAAHPDLAEELRKFFADQERLAAMVSPLRASAGGPPAVNMVGRSFDDYELLGEIARGGMGVVYRARQISLNRTVALKMIAVERLSDPGVYVRFQREARLVAQFDHPNIVRVYGFGEYASRPYYALEFVSGGSLAEHLSGRPWSPVVAAHLVARLADAIAYAHDKDIVHRDLKPANVLLAPSNAEHGIALSGMQGFYVPKITDFGLSKRLQTDSDHLTLAGDRLGTPAYMAPEQADGRPSDKATDIFGLGAIFYELLTGRPPFQGETIAEVVKRARAGEFRRPRQVNPGVPPNLERICLKAMAADPEQRYHSVAAMALDLRRALRPRRWLPWLSAAAVLTIVVGSISFLAGHIGARQNSAGEEGGLAEAESPTDERELARRAEAMLRTHCYRCHGKGGSVEGGFNDVLDPPSLVARKKVIPHDPEHSRLFKRVARGDMPPEEESTRPTPAEIETLRQWIAAGAPAFDPNPSGRKFLEPEPMLRLIRDDLERANNQDRPFLRYFTLTHLFNAGLPEDGLQSYRAGLAKLVNALSWEREITPPPAIDPARTVFRIDLRHYRWDAKMWDTITEACIYKVGYTTDAARACAALSGCAQPHVRADWFVFAASRPPLYHHLLRLPATDRELEHQLGVDVERELREFRAVRAGFNRSGVAQNNRLLERHPSKYGAYWKSYDFAGNDGRQNLFKHPLGPGTRENDFQHDGSEIIFSLPNGMHGYFLADAAGRRIDVAPITVVKDVRQKDATVRNGISCMACHVGGIIEKEDQVRKHAERSRGAFSIQEHDTIRALYPPPEAFQALVQQDRKRYAAAVEQTGVPPGKTDPIVALAARYEWDLDLALAAAEVGLTAAEFQERLTESKSEEIARLFGSLRTQGGTVRRQVFEKNFKRLVGDLQLGVVPNEVAATNNDGIVVNSIGMKLKAVPAERYSIGSTRDEPGREEGEVRRTVDITKPYFIGVHEVTQEQYTKVIGTNPSYFAATGGGRALVQNQDTRRFPVESLSWLQAREFCERLSAMPEEKAAGRHYRLPSEAEWEIACRAGASTAYGFGNEAARLGEFGWYEKNASNMPRPVGQLKPNAWGLHDMHGNVREWCADQWDSELPFRVQRGGSWLDSPKHCRSAYRGRSLETFGGEGGKNFGLRVVMEVRGPN